MVFFYKPYCFFELRTKILGEKEANIEKYCLEYYESYLKINSWVEFSEILI